MLTLNRGIQIDERVQRDSGEMTYPIWLLVNPKYPSAYHDIWRPILEEIQDRVYREMYIRIDTSNIYIRKTVIDSELVPNTLNWWGKEVAKEINVFREMVHEHKPKILITFGAFPFEFVRRVFNIKPEKGPKAWSTSILRDEFEKSIENFDINKTNRIPLLRRVVSSDKLMTRAGRETYVNYVGAMIADRIIENRDSLNIWIE